MRETIVAAAARVPNLRYVGYQPAERLAEVLSAADIHVVPLRNGLGAVSVPSKTYSVLAVSRPVIAAMDAESAIVRLLEESGAGVSVPPDELAGLLKAVDDLLENQDRRLDMGARGREWVMKHASPIAAAVAYEKVLAGTEIG
jgi:colanic acid biosynthesis glycosyl transferase WcaI